MLGLKASHNSLSESSLGRLLPLRNSESRERLMPVLSERTTAEVLPTAASRASLKRDMSGKSDEFGNSQSFFLPRSVFPTNSGLSKRNTL